MNWQCSLQLDESLAPVQGGSRDLQRAIGGGADLRIYTTFRYNEHVDTASANAEIVDEVSDFRVTYLIDHRWVAGVMSQRMPIEPPNGFGPRPSMSFFLYNQNGEQAIARPYFDGINPTAERGPSEPIDHSAMPRYEEKDRWDDGTNAPSSNFTYRFGHYRFLTNESWREVYAHNAKGARVSGSLDALADAFRAGGEVKVGIRGLCDDLGEDVLPHEVFVQCGPGYYHRDQKVFCAGTQPVVRVAPAVPLRYQSGNWDFGSLFLRTDGMAEYWRCDPYTLQFTKQPRLLAIRWFVRE